MSLEQSEAIILRVYPWSETSLVVSLYAREFGKLSLVAKGARRPKSPFEAALDLLSICRVVFISKSSDALDILTEAKLERRFRAGSWDMLRLNCGFYVVELLDRLTDKGDRQPEIFDLAKETLTSLEDKTSEPGAVVLRFELGMLRMTGNLPSLRSCVQCGKRVESQNWVTVGILMGGVLCESCGAGARHTLRIPSLLREQLEYFSRPDWRGIEVSTNTTGQHAFDDDAALIPTANEQYYSTQHRSALRNLMNRYLTSLLDRKLQLHAFLEELGR